MFREFFFYTLFGLITIVGAFLAAYWSRLSYERYRGLEPGCRLWDDRYFMICLALSINSYGTSLVFGVSVVRTYFYGLSPTTVGVTGWIIGLGLFMLLLAKLIMVRLADMELQKPRLIWAVSGITLVWSAICLALAINN